jgi:hypothetical protein
MNDVFTETLRNWQNFYFMAGGASAALLGLMFVALSLGMHLIDKVTIQTFEDFASPSVHYFVSALIIACVMLVPAFTPPMLALVLFLGGAWRLTRTVKQTRRIIETARRAQDFDVPEWAFQVVLPNVSYALLLIASLALLIEQVAPAFFAIWFATVALMLCAISNTWSLVLWIVEQHKE